MKLSDFPKDNVGNYIVDDVNMVRMVEAVNFESCLSAAGVNNWEGYSYALEIFNEGE